MILYNKIDNVTLQSSLHLEVHNSQNLMIYPMKSL